MLLVFAPSQLEISVLIVTVYRVIPPEDLHWQGHQQNTFFGSEPILGGRSTEKEFQHTRQKICGTLLCIKTTRLLTQGPSYYADSCLRHSLLSLAFLSHASKTYKVDLSK
ncbi:hypothetical protein AVEN_217874-1 [Araneus ventricosus]|uniref:Uncharacterized protein n=1 Tax=Araneus ventricosus TaxID=182803 RepID=A0A4Y2RQS7_ARAVE|nr:hypothetical protein AVEN_217874-1 [Araneus ventricosus]